MVQYYFEDGYENLFVLRFHDKYLPRGKCWNEPDPTLLLLRPLHIILCNQVQSEIRLFLRGHGKKAWIASTTAVRVWDSNAERILLVRR
jgi:hypothetical protein